MHALLRYLLAIALVTQLALAGLCLTHDEDDVSLRVIHPPCAHEHEIHIATFRLRALDAPHDTSAGPSPTAVHAASMPIMLLLPTAVRYVLAIHPRLSEAHTAVLGARGPPCAR